MDDLNSRKIAFEFMYQLSGNQNFKYLEILKNKNHTAHLWAIGFKTSNYQANQIFDILKFFKIKIIQRIYTKQSIVVSKII